MGVIELTLYRRVHFAPSRLYKKPMTEKERETNLLLLQMAPAPFFGLVGPDLCGNQQHELLAEPGEGNFGSGSWAKTWPSKHSHICILQIPAGQSSLRS